MKSKIICGAMLVLAGASHAREVETDSFKWGLNFESSVSTLTDLALTPGISFQNSKHVFSLGPKFLVDRYDLKSEFAGELNYKFYPSSCERKIDHFFAVNSEFGLRNYDHKTGIMVDPGNGNPVSVIDGVNHSKQAIASFAVGYGLRLNCKKFTFFQAVYAGGGFEGISNDYEYSTSPNYNRVYNRSDFSPHLQINLGVNYRFKS